MTQEPQRTRWLVDLENVGSHWNKIKTTAARGDVIHLFYSATTVKIFISDLGRASANGIQFEFHECFNGLANAMDFQIMCALGMLAAKHPTDRYVLYTGDKGFSSVIPYMADRGITVTRLDPPGLNEIHAAKQRDELAAKMQEAEPRSDEPHSEPARLPDKPFGIREVYRDMLRQTDMNSDDIRIMTAILLESMRLPANKRKLDCRNRMLKRWGNANGTAMYQKLKTVIHTIANNGPWPDKPIVKETLTEQSLKRALVGQYLPEGLAEAIPNAIATANKTKNPLQSLHDQIRPWSPSTQYVDELCSTLSRFLAVP